MAASDFPTCCACGEAIIGEALWHSVCAETIVSERDDTQARIAELEAARGRLSQTLTDVMRQVESDFRSAHIEIMRLQGVDDPSSYKWPEWSPQANTLRWFDIIRAELPPALTEVVKQ